ncbi:hypothetical protein CGGC5_v005896 [Colletotrichum fructicola Nara gc5]|uniref:Uncharacterized protein n=1 Tax=Colletotrichum fructicola (strain Nara gc5) TaxID=1213859 RepID=A0A7J6JB37_COLFN|nr:hypothetical protein CGGC5_v005896 [Colletotrichum fructicola Nara gc5]
MEPLHCEEETYFSAADSDVGSVGSDDDEETHIPSGDPVDTSVRNGELLDVLSRHFRYWEFSQAKSGRLIICDKFGRFSNSDFEVCEDSKECPHELVPTPHHAGDSCPTTEGCPYAPRQTCQDCEMNVQFKNYKYGEDLGVEPFEDVLLSIAGPKIPPSLFTKLSSLLKPKATIDVAITKANVDRVTKLMEEVGLEAKVLGELSMPVSSRLAQELETGDIYARGDLAREDDEGIYDKLLAWAAGGEISLCVVRGCVPQKKRSANAIAEDCPEAKRIRRLRRPREPRTNRGADPEDMSPRCEVGKM